MKLSLKIKMGSDGNFAAISEVPQATVDPEEEAQLNALHERLSETAKQQGIARVAPSRGHPRDRTNPTYPPARVGPSEREGRSTPRVFGRPRRVLGCFGAQIEFSIHRARRAGGDDPHTGRTRLRRLHRRRRDRWGYLGTHLVCDGRACC